MKVVFKHARIVDEGGIQEPVHLLVENGFITYIGHEVVSSDKEIVSRELFVSPGWFDGRCFTNDPGFDNKDDLTHIKKAALAGGFVEVACLPHTRPVIQSKDVCAYFAQNSRSEGFKYHPLGAATVDFKGELLTEYIDLHRHGVLAFTDSDAAITHPDLVLRALEYLQPLEGLLIQPSTDNRLAKNGQIHEGMTSLLTGQRGIPALAEVTFIQQQIDLAAFSGGRIHLSCVSTAEGCERIRKAKERGVHVTCDMAAHQLFFTDEDLREFDSLLKVWPPFRTLQDKNALQHALIDGTIDCIVSNHHSQDDESKQLEFDLAEFGFGGLQTAFSAVNTATFGALKVDRLVEMMCIAPRKLFRLPIPTVEVGSQVNITAFDPSEEWVYSLENNQAKTLNSPLLGRTLKGKVLATMVGQDSYFFR